MVAVEQLSPHFKQITFGGGDLATYQPTGGLDEFLYVLAPPPGRNDLTIDASFSWDTYEAIPEGDRPVGAYYTVRRWRPEAAELDLLFVLHGEHDGNGGGSRRRHGGRRGRRGPSPETPLRCGVPAPPTSPRPTPTGSCSRPTRRGSLR